MELRIRDKIYSDHCWEAFEILIKENKYSSYFILMDEQTKMDCYPKLVEKNILPSHYVYSIPSGEKSKSLESASNFWKWALEHKVDRHSLCIALGGGVVCDLLGFSASVLKRGIDFIYFPTSLMAMADAAIGGKTAVNFEGHKNQIGQFSLPKAIFIDLEFLESLPERQLKNGFVEVIKHSLIAKEHFWGEISSKSWPISIEQLKPFISKSIDYKCQIVEKDFYEQAERKVLNFGHTFGHAIESYFLSKNEDILHGEALAIGMICELYLSTLILGFPNKDFEEIKEFLMSYIWRGKIEWSDKQGILKFMEADKKSKAGQLKFSLLKNIGEPMIDIIVTDQMIETCFQQNLFTV